MSKPTRKSNFLQTMLLFAVIYLGILMIFKPGQQANQVDPKVAYDKAIASKNPEDISKAAANYANQLRSSKVKDPVQAAKNLELARKLQFDAAVLQKNEAVAKKDFYKGLAAYNEFQKLSLEAPDTEIGKQAAAEMKDTAAKTNVIARNSGGPTQFGYSLIDGLVKVFGKDRAPGFSYWFAAVVMAIAVRAIVWPLAHKQMMGFKRMALLQPMIKELQEKYQGPELQQRTMKLYQKYGINPLAGCWPLLIQMPFFLWVFYSMKTYQFEFAKGTFLWVNPDTAAKFPGNIGANLGDRDVPLVILYGISMIATTIFAVNDPTTAKQARITGLIMAVVFTVLMLFWSFPSAFIIYWIVLNILATYQSVRISKLSIPPLVERPDSEIKKGLFAGLVPSQGPAPNGTNGAPKTEVKTGAPVLHKPKKKKKR